MSIVPPSKYEQLEEEADRLIFSSLGQSHEDKRDILTPWKAYARLSREVLNSTGIALPEVRQGTFGRAYNNRQTWTNSREGVAGLLPQKPRPLGHWMLENSRVTPPGQHGAACTSHHSRGDTSCAYGCSQARARRG